MLANFCISLLVGSALGAINSDSQIGQIWQPAIGSRWQIVTKNSLSVDPARVSGNTPINVPIWDVDLFNTPQEVIRYLHYQGKKVICYFSAGTAEDWRPDYRQFNPADLGSTLSCWPGERWLNIRSNTVWAVTQRRIQLASSKGCDAIDPDNIDVYANGGGGFTSTENDSIAYIRRIAAEARRYGMATGLKNAEQILPAVQNEVQFAVNEGCQSGGECSVYNPFIATGKPVFHIEYAKYSVSQYGQVALSGVAPELQGAPSDRVRQILCLEQNLPGQTADAASAVNPRAFSTVIKTQLLDGWAFYCDGSSAITPTMNINSGGPQFSYCEAGRRKPFGT